MSRAVNLYCHRACRAGTGSTPACLPAFRKLKSAICSFSSRYADSFISAFLLEILEIADFNFEPCSFFLPLACEYRRLLWVETLPETFDMPLFCVLL
jgi:hypothetical protein